MRYINIILIFIAFLSLSNCEKDAEVQSKDYPFVITEIDNLNSDGVTLIGDILNDFKLNGQNIKSVGFLLSSTNSNNSKELRIVQDEYVGGDGFSIILRTDLTKGEQYIVRAFIELTENLLVLGSEISFISKGCQPLPIEVKSVYPKKGTDNTNVIFSGVNFGYNSDLISIYIADKQLMVDSVTSTSVYAKIPENLPTGKYDFSIESYDREFNNFGNFEIKPPEISSFSPNYGFDGTLVEIDGKYFGATKESNVYINDLSCDIIDITDSNIVIVSPETSFYGNTKLLVEVGGKNSNEKEFTIQVQEISDINPLTSKIGSTIHITGQRLLINGYEPIVKLNKIEANTYNLSESSFDFIVPYSLGAHEVSITLGKKTVLFEGSINIEDSWKNYTSLQNLEIESPLTCQYSDKVYFGLGHNTQTDEFDPSFWVFDILTQTWTQLQSLPNGDLSNAHIYKFLFSHESSLHLLVLNQESYNTHHYRYDILEDLWVRLNDTGLPNFDWAVSYKNKIYGATTYGSLGFDPKLYAYDVENDKWDYLYDLPHSPPLFHFILDDRLFVYPQQINSSSNSFYELNIETGEFIAKSRFPGSYWPYRSTENYTLNIENSGYLIYESDINDVWQYNSEIDIWIQHQSFDEKRRDALCYTSNGMIYFGLGKEPIDRRNYLWKNDLWKFER